MSKVLIMILVVMGVIEALTMLTINIIHNHIHEILDTLEERLGRL